MRDAVMSRPEDGVLASIADPKPIRMYDPEDPRRRRAKVQTSSELVRWMEEPDRSPKVMKILEVLAKAERDQRVMANVNERLRDVGFVELRCRETERLATVRPRCGQGRNVLGQGPTATPIRRSNAIPLCTYCFHPGHGCWPVGIARDGTMAGPSGCVRDGHSFALASSQSGTRARGS